MAFTGWRSIPNENYPAHKRNENSIFNQSTEEMEAEAEYWKNRPKYTGPSTSDFIAEENRARTEAYNKRHAAYSSFVADTAYVEAGSPKGADLELWEKMGRPKRDVFEIWKKTRSVIVPYAFDEIITIMKSLNVDLTDITTVSNWVKAHKPNELELLKEWVYDGMLPEMPQSKPRYFSKRDIYVINYIRDDPYWKSQSFYTGLYKAYYHYSNGVYSSVPIMMFNYDYDPLRKELDKIEEKSDWDERSTLSKAFILGARGIQKGWNYFMTPADKAGKKYKKSKHSRMRRNRVKKSRSRKTH